MGFNVFLLENQSFPFGKIGGGDDDDDPPETWLIERPESDAEYWMRHGKRAQEAGMSLAAITPAWRSPRDPWLLELDCTPAFLL